MGKQEQADWALRASWCVSLVESARSRPTERTSDRARSQCPTQGSLLASAAPAHPVHTSHTQGEEEAILLSVVAE